MRQATAVACLLFFLAGASTGLAQPKRFRPAPTYGRLGAPDQAEGRRILEDLRTRGWEGDAYLEFQLRFMPRRGEERLVAGRLWTSRNRQGPVSRLSFLSGDAGRERRLLVQNGPRSAAWTWTSRGDDAVSPVGLAGLFEPIGETELTAFDLQMPYIYWDDFVFEGVINLRGRPAHVFLVYPPAEIVAQRPALTGVRLYLDTAYHALVQSEQIGEGGLLLRSMTLNDLKQVDDQWIAKSIDFRNEATRDKSRFQVTGAALGLRFPEEHFAPSALAEPIAAPPGERVRIVGR